MDNLEGKKKCVACNGTGWYDDCDKDGNPIPCGACSGNGYAMSSTIKNTAKYKFAVELLIGRVEELIDNKLIEEDIAYLFKDEIEEFRKRIRVIRKFD